MVSSVHPKTSGAALGGSAGVVLVGVLHSIHGIYIAPELAAAIPTFLATLGAFLSPGTATATNPPQEPLAAPQAGAEAAQATVYVEPPTGAE